MPSVNHRRLSNAASSAPAARGGELGFTVVELTISLAVTAIVMVVVLTGLEAHSRVARLQVDIADTQQSLRVGHRAVTHVLRMAGRGGLPRTLAVRVDHNVPDDTRIGDDLVEPGTDVLTVRGAVRTPIFRVDSDDPEVFTLGHGTAQLLVDSVTNSGFVQPLDSLEELVEEDGTVPPEAVLLTSRTADTIYAVVELQSITFADVLVDIQNQTVPVRRATLTFGLDPTAGRHVEQYLGLSYRGVFPAELESVLLMTILQEHRFFIRRDHAIPGDEQSPPRLRLCHARMFPGTDEVWGGVESAATEIADNVLDLQVALGVDLDANGLVDEFDDGGAPLAEDEDEWQGNHEADKDLVEWTTAPLHFVRLTMLAQTRSPDRQYVSPSIDNIEDHAYLEHRLPGTGDDLQARRYRRRSFSSVVDLRNL
jgi:type II secretory pathway pseudopilin PulG